MNVFSKENLNDISSSFLIEDSSNLVKFRSNSLDLYQPNNNIITLSNNPSEESRKSSANYVDAKITFNVKDINKVNNNLNNEIDLLRKKTKITFNIEKQTENETKFFTTKYITKTDCFFSKKGHNKKKKFQTCKNFYLDNPNKNINSGRWTYEEHIKFIESLVNYGKKWENIQKYIGTRNCRQIRSHAQKFFRSLKKLKTDKYNLRKNNIKSLLDVVNLIAKSNKTNKNNKKYIIDTLIDLTKLNLESIGKKYFEGKNDNLIIGIKKEELVNDNISKIYDEKLNTINSSIKELKYNNLFSSINLIENEDIIPNKKYDSEEIYVNNNILLKSKEENICNNNDKIIQG